VLEIVVVVVVVVVVEVRRVLHDGTMAYFIFLRDMSRSDQPSSLFSDFGTKTKKSRFF